jgi:hypothetical protein
MNEMVNSPMMDKTVWEKKYIYKDEDKMYATRGTGNTALGLSIGALALTVLGRNGLNNILGGITGNGTQVNPEETAFGLYKGYTDADSKIIEKHNKDAFDLYAYSRNGFDALQAQISDLKTKLAVTDAVRPYQDRMIYEAIALEKERREAADCQIVGYTNCTFIPQYVADITPAATSTQKTTFNPLNCLNRGCGC